ncbi:hypothetical protein [Actinomadura atramentaria]|uniref:hypothetical protein n=1 Tax=Actinomadura atramentaria TaxID=1990 RepID=UPI0003672592|nr:hypothetical protein [Actinomadura atramentaria]
MILKDRKILQARATEVIEVRTDAGFHLHLTEGLSLEYSGEMFLTVGREGDESARPLSGLSAGQLTALISARPLSWVVFNDGDQRIVFSNRWFLESRVRPGETWRLVLGGGAVLTHPPAPGQ